MLFLITAYIRRISEHLPVSDGEEYGFYNKTWPWIHKLWFDFYSFICVFGHILRFRINNQTGELVSSLPATISYDLKSKNSIETVQDKNHFCS